MAASGKSELDLTQSSEFGSNDRGTVSDRVAAIILGRHTSPRLLRGIAWCAFGLALLAIALGADIYRSNSLLRNWFAVERNVYDNAADWPEAWLDWGPDPMLENMPHFPVGISAEFVLRPLLEGADLTWAFQYGARHVIGQRSLAPVGPNSITEPNFPCAEALANLVHALSMDGNAYWFLTADDKIFHSADGGTTCTLVLDETQFEEPSEVLDLVWNTENIGGNLSYNRLLALVQPTSIAQSELKPILRAMAVDDQRHLYLLPEGNPVPPEQLEGSRRIGIFLQNGLYADEGSLIGFRSATRAIAPDLSLSRYVETVSPVTQNVLLALPDPVSRHWWLEEKKGRAVDGGTIPPEAQLRINRQLPAYRLDRGETGNSASLPERRQATAASSFSDTQQTVAQSDPKSDQPVDGSTETVRLPTIEQRVEDLFSNIEIGSVSDPIFAAEVSTADFVWTIAQPRDADPVFSSRIAPSTRTQQIDALDIEGLWIRDVAASNDGRQIWLSATPRNMLSSTERPQIYYSRDAGQSFEHVSEQVVLPHAIWASLSLAFVFGALSIGAYSRARRIQGETEDLTRTAVSGLADTPVGLQDTDVMGLHRLATGIANVIHNSGTSPPLTFGITGSWGSGKSSLMTMLRQDLEARSGRVIWFNAWHHQSEETALAALLEQIRKKAVPPFWTGSGLWFRIRLLFHRRQGVVNFLVPYCAILLGFVAVYLLSDTRDAIENASEGVEKLEELLNPFVLALFPALLAFVRIARPFKFSPASLFQRARSLTAIVSLEDNLSVRHNFQNQFKDVTDLLNQNGNDLVIIIDDLDRCSPDHVRMILDSVNFLSSAGKCYVVIGYDKERVHRLLETQYEAEHPDEDIAERYLQKIINIEVAVPQFEPAMAEDLIDAVTGHPETSEELSIAAENAETLRKFDERKRQQRLLSVVDRIAGFIFILFVTSLVTLLLAGIVQSWPSSDTPKPPPPSEANVTQPANDTGPTADGLSEATVDAAGPDQQPTEVAGAAHSETVQLSLSAPIEEETAVSASVSVALVVALAALVLVLLLFDVLRQRQRRLNTITDTDELKLALKDWTPIVQSVDATPRNLKRFINHTRLIKECIPDAFLESKGERMTVAYSALRQVAPQTIAAIKDVDADKQVTWRDLAAELPKAKHLTAMLNELTPADIVEYNRHF